MFKMYRLTLTKCADHSYISNLRELLMVLIMTCTCIMGFFFLENSFNLALI